MADFLSVGFISGRGRGGYGKSIGPAYTDYSNFGKKYQIRIFGERGHIYIPKGMAAGAAAEGGYLMMEKILNLIMRAILGTIAMYFVNSLLDSLGMSLGVGINAATVLTSAVLGFPGLLALYGIGIYKTL
jgi:hypothetical protein|nr:pro-sigmaK processing inhibitor BofA family protein [uncultured Acetatifactor sp.]